MRDGSLQLGISWVLLQAYRPPWVSNSCFQSLLLDAPTVPIKGWISANARSFLLSLRISKSFLPRLAARPGVFLYELLQVIAADAQSATYAHAAQGSGPNEPADAEVADCERLRGLSHRQQDFSIVLHGNVSALRRVALRVALRSIPGMLAERRYSRYRASASSGSLPRGSARWPARDASALCEGH